MKQSCLTTREYLPLIRQYERQFSLLTEWLLAENARVNLTRITDPCQIRIRHFLDSLAALSVLDSLARPQEPFCCVDIGSGAGFPVLPLAIVRPQWRFVSIEATGKKARFQQRVCEALGLSGVRVICGRAEELSHDRSCRGLFDAALARAVADVSVLAELTLGWIRPGGRMIAWKSPQAAEEIAHSRPALERMGGAAAEVLTYLLEDDSEQAPIRLHLVVSEKIRPTPKDLPRSFAQIKEHPLSLKKKEI